MSNDELENLSEEDFNFKEEIYDNHETDINLLKIAFAEVCSRLAHINDLSFNNANSYVNLGEKHESVMMQALVMARRYEFQEYTLEKVNSVLESFSG